MPHISSPSAVSRWILSKECWAHIKQTVAPMTKQDEEDLRYFRQMMGIDKKKINKTPALHSGGAQTKIK